MKEFWSEMATRASWEKLTQLAREYNFTLIGGWATYLWTKAHKSKTIDIVTDYPTLDKLSKKYSLTKNNRLKKYEIKEEKFDIDIYLPHYSKIGFPLEDLEKHRATVQGITTITPEVLMIMKQTVEVQRRGSLKGRKDLIDILTLLIHSPFKHHTYLELLKEYNKENLKKELKKEINLFSERDLNYLGMNKHTYAKWKKKFINPSEK